MLKNFLKNKKPCIICVAITGSVGLKINNPSIPISINEQVESTQESFEAGASIVHCHVRNEDGSPSSSVEKFFLLKEGIKKYCPEMVIQFSTGGRSGNGKNRGKMLTLKPEMASLSIGSTNFPDRVYENSPELIDWLITELNENKIMPEVEIFDLSHIFQLKKMYDKNSLTNFYIQFVMGIKNSMPANFEVFKFYLKLVKEFFPQAQWCAAGIGKDQFKINDWASSHGGHIRTGLEDNIRVNKETLASSNAELVKKAVQICLKNERTISSCNETRKILGLEN